MIKDAFPIYWFLFWDIGIETLNNKVDEARRKQDWKQVEFFCKVIALKSMNIDKDKFWEREVLGIC